MTKRQSILLSCVFCLFISVFAALHWLLPDRDFSQNENRYLQQLPVPVLNGESANITNGKFMSSFETYITDQFPGRDAWMSLKAASELAIGKTVNNNVYFGENDTLFSGLSTPAEATVDQALGFVDKLVGNVEVPVYFSLVPDKLNIWGDRLRDPLALSVNYLGGDLWQKAPQTQAHWVDLYTAFQSHAGEDLYYRTDHHWTSLGAYYAYEALMTAMGQTPAALSELEKTTVTTDFLGTTFSSSGAGWIKPDQIDAYVPADGVTVTVYENGLDGEAGSLYHPDQLQVKDKYAYFMGGNQPLYVLQTEQEGPKVLVIRDSYSDALAPFLTLNFSEVHLFDPRYNRTSISSYVAEHEIDAVVVLYSLSNFVTDNNLFILGL